SEQGVPCPTCPTAPPSITGAEETRNITVPAGELLTLECPAAAVPPPHIEWQWQGSLLQVGARAAGGGRAGAGAALLTGALWVCQEDARVRVLDGGRFLRLRALLRTDSSEFSCTASNALGSTSLRFHVDVHG
ncbi:HMCN2 protein, partial [Nothocercus julius]|nr:HMCN2 protein [Nothocercus julius]